MSDAKHAAWIAMKVEATLSHYPSDWKMTDEARAVAMDDWLAFLAPLSRKSIENAVAAYMRDEPRVRPTPGDIRAKARQFQGNSATVDGDRSALDMNSRFILENRVLPGARRWISDYPPGSPLYRHAEQTLNYWKETTP